MRKPISRRPAGLVALAAASMTTAALALPGAIPAVAASPSSARASSHGRVAILSPRAGALFSHASRHAAARAKVHAVIRVSGTSVAHLSVQLNGHRVRGVAVRLGRQSLVLSRADGLAVGYNVLVVSATMSGSDQSAQTAHRFIDGYRTPHLLSASLRRGSGARPAAVASVRAPLKNVFALRAQLNGRHVNLPGAHPARHGLRVLSLDLAQLGRLRRGRNHLLLRLAMDDGRVRVVRRAFQLDRHRDIAVVRRVGPVAQAVVGSIVTLDGSRSRLAGGRLHGRWFLLHKPHRSHLKLRVTRGARTRLVPDVPGHYVVGFKTRVGAKAGDDVIDVPVTYNSLLVPFDTDATVDAQQGLLVGGTFWPYSSHDFTVIQLDGYTLAPTHNNDYDATASGLSQMESDLASADPSALVFILAPYGNLPSGEVDDINNAIGTVGGNLGAGYAWQDAWCSSIDTTDCQFPVNNGFSNKWVTTSTNLGAFTMIGVPNMQVGQAWRETAQQNDGSPSINGYLTPGVASSSGLSGTYTVINGQSDPFLPVNTCVNLGDAACGMTVGGQSYHTSGANGFHVVVLDRTTLAMIKNDTDTTYAELEADLNVQRNANDAGTVAHYIFDETTHSGDAYPDPSPVQSDQSLVLIQSVGDGTLTGTPTTNLYQLLDQLGGTLETFTGSIQQGDPYAFIGVADNLPWHGTDGLESSKVMDDATSPGQPSGQIDGVITQDRTGLYAPLTGAKTGPMDSDLASIVFQQAQAWPYAGDPALPYIADHIGLAGYPDVRSAYTNINVIWGQKQALLTTLTCSDTSQCGPNFTAVKTELLKEFGWVTTDVNFVKNIMSPYLQNGTGAIFAVDSIYDSIKATLPPPPPVHTSWDWFGFIQDLAAIGSDLAAPLAGNAAAALTLPAVWSLIADVAVTGDGGAPSNEVAADAPDNLSAALATQQTAMVEGMDRMESILLTDYGKLQAVAQKAGGGDPNWALTPDITIDMINSLNASTRGQTYTSLVPEVYGGTVLEPNSAVPSTYATTNDVNQYECHNDDHTFAPALAANQFHAVSRFYNGETQSNVWTFANDTSTSSPQFPTSSLTDDIYGPQARSNQGAAQYAPTWWRQTFNPPGGVQCSPPNDGSSWLAPNVTPPLP